MEVFVKNVGYKGYYCSICGREHRQGSRIYQKHRRRVENMDNEQFERYSKWKR